MAHKLGISIYPNHSTPENDKEYISLASKYGFSRLFTCLLSVDDEKEQVLENFKDVIRYARQLGMEVIADVSPRIFQQLNISYSDLSFFAELGASGIRLDLGFNGHEEAAMTYNPFDLKIELNMSNATKYVDHVLSCQPEKSNLLGCHNFYPHRYSGLSYPFFLECSKKFKDQGIRTAAFVSSSDATFGPWPIMEGLPTLEMHRNLSIETQVKHLLATGLIDDVIIGNAYASEKELAAVGKVNPSILTFSVELDDSITELEKIIVLEEPHFYRGDVSEYLIRSTQSRVKYKGREFLPSCTKNIRRGDILIDNDLYGQYAGELQIALKDMENSGKTNVVGRIKEDEMILLDYLKPWDKFAFQN